MNDHNEAPKRPARLGRPRKEQLPIDREWFLAQFRRVGMNMMQVAAGIRRRPETMTRVLQGKGRFNADDLANLSGLLKVPIDELVRRSGHVVAEEGLAIVGKITGDARVSNITERKGTLLKAHGYPSGAHAYVADTASAPGLALYHDAAFIVTEPRPPGPDVPGRLAIVEVDNELLPLLGVLGRGSAKGTFPFTVFGTGETKTVRRVHRASVVLAILFP